MPAQCARVIAVVMKIKFIIISIYLSTINFVAFAIQGDNPILFKKLANESNIIASGNLFKIDVTEDPYFDLLNGASAYSNSFYRMDNIYNIKGIMSGNSLLAIDHRISHLNMGSGNQFLVFLKKTKIKDLKNTTNIPTYRIINDWKGIYSLSKGNSKYHTSSKCYLSEKYKININKSSFTFIKTIEYYVKIVLTGNESKYNKAPSQVREMLADLNLLK
jgi:hypothetical protein